MTMRKWRCETKQKNEQEADESEKTRLAEIKARLEIKVYGDSACRLGAMTATQNLNDNHNAYEHSKPKDDLYHR